jgi:hypothetical protein
MVGRIERFVLSPYPNLELELLIPLFFSGKNK